VAPRGDLSEIEALRQKYKELNTEYTKELAKKKVLMNNKRQLVFDLLE